MPDMTPIDWSEPFQTDPQRVSELRRRIRSVMDNSPNPVHEGAVGDLHDRSERVDVQRRRFECDACGEYHDSYRRYTMNRRTRSASPDGSDGPFEVCETCYANHSACGFCSGLAVFRDGAFKCLECSRESAYCGVCNATGARDAMVVTRMTTSGYSRDTRNVLVCSRCAGRVATCEGDGCEVRFRRSPYSSRTCMDCAERRHRILNGREVMYKGARTTRRSDQFGYELEMEFEDTPHEDVYGSGVPLEPFFGGWQSRGDGSLSEDGVELVSPILKGPGGVAEVVHTMDLCRDEYGAYVNRACGGHITVGLKRPSTRLQAIRLFGLMEEAAFALTGGWGRYRSESYCRPIKGRYFDHIGTGASFGHEKYSSVHDRGDYVCALEFRYPPGTLNPAQFVINLGVAQLMTRLASGLPQQTIDSMIDTTLPFYSSHSFDGRVPTWHVFVLYGLSVMADQGWVPGGKFWGVPYNPTIKKNLDVVVTDRLRGTKTPVTLPSADQLTDRMERQLNRFYSSAERDTGISNKPREDAVSIIYGEPTERATEMLLAATKGAGIVLPSAGSLQTVR